MQPVDHHDEPVAQRIHAVQMLAYRQEAQLLGAVFFPPLQRTVQDICQSADAFTGAFLLEELVGVLGVGPDEEGRGLNIASLVVHPALQRQGIAYQLMAHLITRHGADELTVQTGANNAPALALYQRFGFTEYRRWWVGQEPLELVKLCRAKPSPASAAAKDTSP